MPEEQAPAKEEEENLHSWLAKCRSFVRQHLINAPPANRDGKLPTNGACRNASGGYYVTV